MNDFLTDTCREALMSSSSSPYAKMASKLEVPPPPPPVEEETGIRQVFVTKELTNFLVELKVSAPCAHHRRLTLLGEADWEGARGG